jgi:hypothetical protein
MKFVVSLFAFLAVGLAAPALAADDAAPKPKKEKKVCRRDVDTGTIMQRSICRTQTEWSKIDAAQAKQTDRDTAAMNERSGGLGSIAND